MIEVTVKQTHDAVWKVSFWGEHTLPGGVTVEGVRVNPPPTSTVGIGGPEVFSQIDSVPEGFPDDVRRCIEEEIRSHHDRWGSDSKSPHSPTNVFYGLRERLRNCEDFEDAQQLEQRIKVALKRGAPRFKTTGDALIFLGVMDDESHALLLQAVGELER